MEALKNAVAEQTLTKILDDKDKAVNEGTDTYDSGKYPKPYATGYFKDMTKSGETMFVAFDNSDGNCWVEDFVQETDAIAFANVDNMSSCN